MVGIARSLLFVTSLIGRSIKAESVYIQNGHFDVYTGYLVNTVDATVTVRSINECSSACHAMNGVTPNTCLTATFDSVTNVCQISSDGLADTSMVGGTSYKTVLLTKVCGLPPFVSNGGLFLTSETTSGSTATLICNDGYEPLPNGPVTTQCSAGTDWTTAGMACRLSPPTSYYGFSFITGFMQTGGIPNLIITSFGGDADVNIIIPHLEINEQLTTVGNVLTKTYTAAISSSTSNVTSNKAILVTADRPIMLYSVDLAFGTSDGSFVLPEVSLGTDYIISGHPSTNGGTDEFMIIGTTDNTVVTLEFKTATPETVIINRLDTHARQGTDMSGTMIQATAPIYVLSGHFCANIPDNSVIYCDYIAEIMPPISSLGSVHVVSFMKPRISFTVSIVAPYDQLSVKIYNTIGNLLEKIDMVMKDVVFRTYSIDLAILVVSTAPVLVTQYGHGSGFVNDVGDPSMMIIPDVSSFGYVYDFWVPSGFTSTLAVVIADSNILNVLLDGQSLISTELVSVMVTGYDTYTVLYTDISVGYHNLSHATGNAVSFGAWIYGRSENVEYAWTLGMTV